MSLYALIEPYLYKPFQELPLAVQERVNEDFEPGTWDALSGGGRYLWVRARDDRNDVERANFARALTHKYWFNLQDEILRAEREISDLQSLIATCGSDADLKRAETELAIQLVRQKWLQGKWHQPEDLAAKKQLDATRSILSQAPAVVDIPRALQFLSENTGTNWTDVHLFSLVSNSDISLHAAIPPWTQIHLVKWDKMSPVILPFVRPGCEVMAMLWPPQVEEMWVTGHTSTSNFVSPESVLLDPDSQVYLKAPMRVSRSELRLTKTMLLSILQKWEESRRPIGPLGPFTGAAEIPNNASVGQQSMPNREGNTATYVACAADYTQCKTPGMTSEDQGDAEVGLLKREKQIIAIITQALALKYEPLSVPDGGKATLMKICMESRPDLFGAGPDPFTDAWKEGVKRGRLRMANHRRYSRK